MVIQNNEIMKKILLTIIGLLIAGNVALVAQLLDEKAPNFTLTDLNGNSHTLYDYLGEGKPVILYFGATWCPPCWSFYATNILQDVYLEFGPAGSDDIAVFYVEVDPATTIEDLEGSGGDTLGDYVFGTTYPIMNPDNAEVPMAFGVEIPPLIYIVQTDTTFLQESLYIENRTLENLALDAVSSIPLTKGTDARIFYYDGELNGCEAIQQSVIVRNDGTETLTEFTLQVLNEKKEVLANIDWDGSLDSKETVHIDLGSVVIENPTTNFIFQITTEDDNLANNFYEKTLQSSPLTDTQIRVFIFTDAYAEDENNQWRIEDESGNVIAESGPMLGFTQYDQTISIPTDGCYSFIIDDEFGDGMSTGVVSVRDGNGQLIFGDASFGEKGQGDFFALSESVFDAALVRLDNSLATRCGNSLEPNITISNYGNVELNNLTIEYSINEETLNTFEWTGKLTFNESATIQLPAISYEALESNQLKINLLNPGAVVDNNQENNQLIEEWQQPTEEIGTFTLELQATKEASDISWQMMDNAANLIAAGGPYTETDLTETQVIEIPITDITCHHFSIQDAKGDGFINGGSFQLKNSAGEILLAADANERFAQKEFNFRSQEATPPVSTNDLKETLDWLQIDQKNNQLHIQLNEQEAKLYVQHLDGRILKKSTLPLNAGWNTIEQIIPNNEKGVFIITIVVGQEIFNKKMVRL